jgi:hypothetical protein
MKKTTTLESKYYITLRIENTFVPPQKNAYPRLTLDFCVSLKNICKGDLIMFQIVPKHF